MPKFEDIFIQSNTEYPIVIVDIPSGTQETQYGPKYKVKVEKDGVQSDWFMKIEQFERNFTDGMSNVLYAAGDEILVAKVKNEKYKWPFYTVNAGRKGVGASAPSSVSTTNQKTNSSSANNEEYETKQYQIASAGCYQARLSSGQPTEEARAETKGDVRFLQKLAAEMMMEDKEAGKAVEEVFGEPAPSE